MNSSTELFRVGVTALLVGIAIPLAVQLFFVLRNLQRVTATLDRRLDRTLKDVGELVAEARRVSVPAPSLTSQLVAAVPAVVAAARAIHERSGP